MINKIKKIYLVMIIKKMNSWNIKIKIVIQLIISLNSIKTLNRWINQRWAINNKIKFYSSFKLKIFN
jgi:hypothetical protein